MELSVFKHGYGAVYNMSIRMDMELGMVVGARQEVSMSVLL